MARAAINIKGMWDERTQDQRPEQEPPLPRRMTQAQNRSSPDLDRENSELIRRAAELLKISHADARKAAQVVLHAIRDRLPRDVLIRFGEQLPSFERRLYFSGWKSNPPLRTTFRAFLSDIQEKLPEVCRNDPISATRAVVLAIRECIDGRAQIRKVKEAFSPEMQPLFEPSRNDVHPCAG